MVVGWGFGTQFPLLLHTLHSPQSVFVALYERESAVAEVSQQGLDAKHLTLTVIVLETCREPTVAVILIV